MRVKTLKKHSNRHGMPSIPYEKNVGRIYTLPDGEAEALIASGRVARHDEADEAA